MRICHVTPHLPPDQAANALLPFHLGQWAVDAGHEVAYVAHPPRATGVVPQPGPVTWVPARRHRSVLRLTKAPSLYNAFRTMRRVAPAIRRADVVHVHSNGLLAEVGAWVARRRRKPLVVTLYGTEIWHYRRKRGVDLFTRMFRRASAVVFYSRLLQDRARELGLSRPGLRVIYPPVPEEFAWCSEDTKSSLRHALGISEAHLLVNVKRLHPLAEQRTLIDAMPAIVDAHPDTRLIICGTGPLRDELEALAGALGVGAKVTFAGLVENRKIARYCAAADLFVLPSRLEALPTVAVEALASGTPVVSSDNPGGLELQRLFGDDVQVVPRADAGQLAAAVIQRLAQHRRTQPATREIIEREFRPAVVWQRYRDLYRQVCASPRGAPGP